MIVQIVTGIALTIHHDYDTSLAVQSVLYLYYVVYNDNVLRYLHSNGASMVFFSGYMYMVSNEHSASSKVDSSVTIADWNIH